MAVYKRMDERFTGTTIGHGSWCFQLGSPLVFVSFCYTLFRNSCIRLPQQCIQLACTRKNVRNNARLCINNENAAVPIAKILAQINSHQNGLAQN
jgi:hypothetical protein